MILRTHKPPTPPTDIKYLGAAQAATLKLLIETPVDKAPQEGKISARGQVRYKVADDLVDRGLATRKDYKYPDGSWGVMYIPTPAAKQLYRRLQQQKARRAA